ncbi:hypothetical protein ENKNEFLB_03260 [Nocardioides aquaticus]|uniref:Serine protease n=1 Tax=Nocardioides aquaticus TaxID=160826 RepID=A0ABX8EK08_9ACTN|nr:hypothetical protein [Nocardioides aquaticus]QVT80859.1 hypothetical protein ENKNEFLB_03260 [Nocardioides aquaticus]
MTRPRRTHVARTLAALVLASGAAAATTAVTAAPATAEAGGRWAPADIARIHPGVQMYTRGAQCTANFVFTDARDRTYVGYAAHCAGLGEATDTDGCQAESLPLGTRVSFTEGGSLVDGGTRVGRGTLAYSSWRTMDRIGTTAANPCAYNDFALVRVDRDDARSVNPSVPFFGGPTGIDRDGTARGDRVFSYGNSSIRGGLEVLSPKVGASLGDAPADGGWSHPLYTVTPGIPGDSGSGFLTAGGTAVGTLSTLGLAPLPASNNIGDLGKELRFAQRHSGIDGLRLVRGTEAFDPAVPIP